MARVRREQPAGGEAVAADVELALRPAENWVGFAARVAALARLFEASGAFILRANLAGPALSAADVQRLLDQAEENEELPVPAALYEMARAFNGLRLEWRTRARTKNAAAGHIELRTVQDIQAEPYGSSESEQSWQVFEGTQCANIDATDEGDAVQLFELGNAYYVGGSCLIDAANIAVDLLGLPGWEMELFEVLEYADDVDLARHETGPARAKELWATLTGGRVPPSLHRRLEELEEPPAQPLKQGG